MPQPPFPSELLADLHADNLAPELREQLWPMVRTDPDALRYLNDLDEVNTHLRTLADDDVVVHRMPDDVADRMFRFVAELDASEGPTERVAPVSAIADGPTERTTSVPADAELESGDRITSVPTIDAAQPGPISLAQYRSRRRMGFLAAAAATIAVLAGAGYVVKSLDTTDGTPTAAPLTEPASPGDDITTAAALSALGKRDVRGPLADEAALTRCVRANGIDRAVLGASSITFRGDDAVLVLLTGPQTPTITALVVGTGCTTGAPSRLALRDIG
ncbi:hypothetical protein [Nocardia caishijiensis]|uniref:hypothetical protein n=1 Tax=Nocardia caishijiensis TaxID=184756 RepID=UPI0008318857|nr:hypothetical protein [Nocardia caishijiensis]